jgi:hypothetical protein
MKKIVLISVFLFYASLCTIAQTKDAPQNAKSNAVIKFDSLVHDFGTVYQGANGNCEFKFTNKGKEPLILSNVMTSCGCTIASWPKEPILPKRTGVIKVNYTKMSIAGTISKQITVYSNAKNGTIILSIKGTVLEKPKITSPEKPVDENGTPLAK